MVEIQNKDIFTQFLSWLAQWLMNDGQDEYLMILRILAIQASTLIGASSLFKDEERNPNTVRLFALMYSILGLIVPIELIIVLVPLSVQPPLFLISVILVFYLPGYLAFLLSPSREKYQPTRKILTATIVVLIIIA